MPNVATAKTLHHCLFNNCQPVRSSQGKALDCLQAKLPSQAPPVASKLMALTLPVCSFWARVTILAMLPADLEHPVVDSTALPKSDCLLAVKRNLLCQ